MLEYYSDTVFIWSSNMVIQNSIRCENYTILDYFTLFPVIKHFYILMIILWC